MPQGVVCLAVTSLYGNLPLMTSQVGVSTEMCDGQMSDVCYSPLGRLVDWSDWWTGLYSPLGRLVD